MTLNQIIIRYRLTFSASADGTTAGPNFQGVLVNGSGNSIGGTTAGAANSIGFNTGNAITVASGSGNAIRQNLVFGNGAGIILVGGANNDQSAPTVSAVASVSNLTTIDYEVTGNPGQRFTIDFFASTSLGGPAAQFLGSVSTPDLSFPLQQFTATFALATPIPTGQTVTATATSTNNDTSEFAASVGLSAPFVVTNTTDNQPGSEVGSLRQVILDANDTPPTSGTDPITFNIPGVAPFVISPVAVLPTIIVPITVDGTTEPGVQLNGSGQSFDGLILGAGSGGSTITGLNIVNFAGAGIHVESPGDTITANLIGTNAAGTGTGPGNLIGILVDGVTNTTIGGTSAAGANTIGFSTSAGILISGGNASQNLVIGNDIVSNTYGVQIFNASNNTIGGVSGAPNTIGSNTSNGIAILSGSGNVVRHNTYTASNGILIPTEANDIGLGPGANNGQPAPVLISASLSGNQLSLAYTDAVAAGTVVTLDIYSVDTTTNQRTFLGTPPTPVAVGAHASSVTISAPGLTADDEIIATATVVSPDNGTSTFSNRVATSGPTTVTNTLDEDDNGNPLPGSLRAAITNASANATIDFQIPGTGPFVIALQASLPAFSVPLAVDGRTQHGFVATNPSTFVDVTGGNGSFGGFTLGANSGGAAPGSGSTIEGLAIENFGGPAINVLSSNNTIGGSIGGQGNVIAFNSGAAVTVNSGTGNLIEGNLIFGSVPQTGISLVNNGNDNPAAPRITGVTSSGGSTIITLDVTTQPVASGTYLLQFFASTPGDSTSGAGVPGPHTCGQHAGHDHPGSAPFASDVRDWALGQPGGHRNDHGRWHAPGWPAYWRHFAVRCAVRAQPPVPGHDDGLVGGRIAGGGNHSRRPGYDQSQRRHDRFPDPPG